MPRFVGVRFVTTHLAAVRFGTALVIIAALLCLASQAHADEACEELSRQADAAFSCGDLDSAIRLAEQALAQAEAAFGRDDLEVAWILADLGRYHLRGRSYDDARRSYSQALDILRHHPGPRSAEYAEVLDKLGLIAMYERIYDEAERIHKQALAIMEEAEGKSDFRVAKIRCNLAELYVRQQRYPEAEQLYLWSLPVMREAWGEGHHYVARILYDLADACMDQAKYSEAEHYYGQALNVLKGCGEVGRGDRVMCMTKLGNLFRGQGRYAEAAEVHAEVLAMREAVLAPDHPDIAESANNLANAYRHQGRYADAEPLYERAYGIWTHAYGTRAPEVAEVRNNLANLYVDQGRYAEAEILRVETLEALRDSLGNRDPRVASALSNLADIRRDQGRLGEALKLYRQAMDIRAETLGEQHPAVAASLSDIARVYLLQGRLAEGERLHKQALALRDRALPDDHPDVAASLCSLVNLYLTQGRYRESDSLCRRALEVREQALGVDHPKVAQVCEYMSMCLRSRGEIDEAMEVSSRAFRIRHRDFRQNGYVLSERDALAYAFMMRYATNYYLSSYLDSGRDDPQTLRLTSDIVLASKGEVSDYVLERRRSAVAERDSTILALAECWRSTRYDLSRLCIAGPRNESSETYKARLDSLVVLANDLESRLARRSASFRRRQDAGRVTTDRITDLLPAGSVLLEYLRYNYLPLDEQVIEPHYLVVALAGDGTLRIVDLGHAFAIDHTINRYREHITKVCSAGHMPLGRDADEYLSVATELYRSLIGPIEDLLEDRMLILIAPDSGLNLVAFGALMDGSGNYLIERAPVHYLSAGRDLVRLSYEDTPSRGLLALGDPDYDATGEERRERIAVAGFAGSAEARLMRSIRSSCDELRGIEVTRLPDTRDEVHWAAKQWDASLGEAALFTGKQASEDNFKAHARGKRVIHIATHGYFLKGDCNPEETDPAFRRGKEFKGENPLLLSGLFLAGANLHGKLADSLGCEDGILTAYEVSAMDLGGNDLVVLSACETGLGKVHDGEGVYGLRRAFQIAGSRTIVSALWPVSDRATKEMMRGLYTESGTPLYERIRSIQLARLAELRQSSAVEHPYDWAGFIALGDWR